MRQVTQSVLVAVTFSILGGVICVAQVPIPSVVNQEAATLQSLSREQFAAHLLQLQAVVSTCAASAEGCKARIASDDKVSAAGAEPAFTEHWAWLRDALDQAGKATPEERAHAMKLAAAHLAALQTEIGAVPNSPDTWDTAKAKKKAAEVLSRSEFRHAAAAQPSWLDRKIARFWMAVQDIINGAGRVGAAYPWLGKVLEWTFFFAAAAGLLLFIRRNFARQQIRISMSSGTAQFSAWDREANDWAAEAETCAAAQQWRDAVHCLYWAAIVRLEARRAWRHNPARTPREYVRLLQAGSPQQGALRGLTGIFERVWYGLRDANLTDYERARSLFTQLSEAPSRSTTAEIV